MNKLKNLWRVADVKRRALYIFMMILVGYGIVYSIGNSLLYVVYPVNNSYVVSQTDNASIKKLNVKLTTDAWNVEGVPAKNITKQRLSVGNIVGVQRYWWFGDHVTVKSIIS